MAEPIQGVGGFVVAPENYFKRILPVVRAAGGLLIIDEVQTGWGRTGQILVRHRALGRRARRHHLCQGHRQRRARGLHRRHARGGGGGGRPHACRPLAATRWRWRRLTRRWSTSRSIGFGRMRRLEAVNLRARMEKMQEAHLFHWRRARDGTDAGVRDGGAGRG